MINTKELMLGNWVYESERSQFPMKVVNIDKDMVYLDFDSNEGDVFEGRMEDIYPIPLTEEMLLKNGFDNVKGFLYASNGDFEIHIEGNLLYMAKSDGSDIAFEKPIKYVHELQNILNVAGIDFDFKI